jgi:hypothetical protein
MPIATEKYRLTNASPRAYFTTRKRSVDSIRNIGFTDTQVYCTTGTRKITFGVAQMLPSRRAPMVSNAWFAETLRSEFADGDSMIAVDRTVAGRVPHRTLWN